MSDHEIKEVCSGTTQLDISYETFCEGYPPVMDVIIFGNSAYLYWP